MKADERDLLAFYRQLDPERQTGLLDYAAFLASREPAEPAPVMIPEPIEIPRPLEESVVRAIKRLRQQYHMLDAGKLLHDTSSHMSRHMIHGVPANEVIDDLERLFRQHYEQMLTNLSKR